MRASRRAALAVLAVAGAAAAGALGWRALGGRSPEVPAARDFPGGHPIDASFLTTGRLAVERMPREVTGALELHSLEIEKTVAVLESKQARVTGTCAPGSAIRVVGEDGSVVCQKVAHGVLSVTALAAIPRASATGTAQGAVPGGVGRYQIAGEDDWLVAPLPLPHGAVVTGFSYVFWDADPKVDGAAYLYRSDDTALAAVSTREAAEEIRVIETDRIEGRKVDATAYGYFVYFQVSARAGQALMPIAASVSYRLP